MAPILEVLALYSRDVKVRLLEGEKKDTTTKVGYDKLSPVTSGGRAVDRESLPLRSLAFVPPAASLEPAAKKAKAETEAAKLDATLDGILGDLGGL